MNTLKFSLLLFAVFLSAICFAAVPSVESQLIELNKYWQNKNLDYEELEMHRLLKNDVELIQMHLKLVERHLRSKNTSHLTDNQKQRRLKSLDHLNAYAQNATFPINLYHKERTPYFIDDFGTACAVGQLIIASGHSALANRIANENNYAFIENMNYPELLDWANFHGFTVDELKWIQPGYGPCDGSICMGQKRNVSCYGADGGCLDIPFDDITLPTPPYSFSWFKYDSLLNWIQIPGYCNLRAGIFRTIVIDSDSNSQTFNHTITQPSEITYGISAQDETGSCNGSAEVQVSGGTPPYRYEWESSANDTTNEISGLCTGVYGVTITDSNYCKKTNFVVINKGEDTLTSSNDLQFIECSVFPNPAEDKLFVKIDASISPQMELFIYDLKGSLVLTKQINTGTTSIDISELKNGIYLVRTESKQEKSKLEKFIKSSF